MYLISFRWAWISKLSGSSDLVGLGGALLMTDASSDYYSVLRGGRVDAWKDVLSADDFNVIDRHAGQLIRLSLNRWWR